MKKAKTAYGQTWKEDYSRDFKGIVRSDRGSSMAFCNICNSHFSIKSSGKFDIKRHFSSQKHVAAQKAAGSSSLLSSFKKTETDYSTIKAEVVFTKFLIEKDLPIAISDDVGELLRTMFPNAPDVKNYRCARTKSTAIIHAMAEHTKKETVSNLLETGVYSLSTDGGNDTKQKLFPVLVRYADAKSEKVVTDILSVDTLESTTATGVAIFSHIKKTVDAHGLDLANCISFSMDNAAVMVGEKSGVAAHLHTQNKNINIIGCPCHRLNLAALRAANTLPFKLDQLLIDVYFFLDKSSKRVARLKELQAILGCQSHEIMKHVNTRWLSLGPCISRLLEQWEPLSALFLEISEDKTSKSTQQKAQTVSKKLLSDEVKAYALFLENVIPVVENANALLQREEPLIQRVRSIFQSVIKDLSLRFINASAVGEGNVFKLDVKKNLLPDDEVDVGFKCRSFVEKELSEDEKKKFFHSVREYLQVGIEYLQKKCNMDNEALVHATVADPMKKSESSFANIQFFISKFKSLLPPDGIFEENMDKMNRQFRQWQASAYVIEKNESIDKYWFRMAKEENQDGQKMFTVLSRCMLGILTIFHSNASCERLFSLIRRNRTDYRCSMSNRLVESLAICKNRNSSFKEPLSQEFLVKAKSATAASLTKH